MSGRQKRCAGGCPRPPLRAALSALCELRSRLCELHDPSLNVLGVLYCGLSPEATSVAVRGADSERIPKNSRAGKQGGRLPVLLGENRRELGEIEAFWNERSRFPEGARLLRPLSSSRVVYNAAAAPKARSASRGRHTRKSPPTHAYGNSSACTHGICTCRSRIECV